VGPARLAHKHGVRHDNLCLAIAAALAYDDPADPQATAMQRAVAAEGLEKVLTEYCGLLPYDDLARAVTQQWLSLVAGPARSPVVGMLFRASPSLDDITRALSLELSERYDPDVVREVLTRVTEEFRDARIWSYVPVLMRRKVADRLREASR
jgi:hypothetical protein